MKLGCFSPPVLWAAQVLLAAGCHAAAGSESLQCEGPVSTRDSGCRPDDVGAREVDYLARGYMFSRPIRLVVSYDWLVLQGPAAPIFEGDPLVLRCQAWRGWPLAQVTFYRDGSALGAPGPNREFSIAVAREVDSGHYHCSAIFQSPGPGSLETASSVAVTVQELFPAPVLRATPSPEPQEGSAVTLSCQTKLPPQRSATRLLFSFHKGGRSVRGRGLSPELQVPAAAQAHSGSYWCEATTEDNHVWKRSPRLEIRVQGPSSSGAPPTLDPAPPKSAGGPAPPSPQQASDPHLHHRMGLLLRQMQDVRVLLGHLVMELRDLSGHLKLETRKGTAKQV
ncbi:PREDICTED: Fc receptor-like A [Myotis davidii]|uniref:Fc receptor-like A n=1 Tax=Myotis davidii TaxID=225400 RepID=UPI0007675313|nr:PREDICTED: Fc receptor-like A [Myotis davidii]